MPTQVQNNPNPNPNHNPNPNPNSNPNDNPNDNPNPHPNPNPKGALPLKKIIHDEFNDFWIIVGLGHAEMAITRLCMRLTCLILGDKFVFAHSFKKGSKGPDYLKSCKSNHKAWIFVQLCRAALNEEIVRCFLLEMYSNNPKDIPSNEEELRNEVIAYVEDDKDDAMFQVWLATLPYPTLPYSTLLYLIYLHSNPSYSTLLYLTLPKNLIWLARLLAASSLFRKALRDKFGHGNSFALDASIKFFLPFMYMLGFKNYAPMLHWAYIRTNHRVPADLRDMLRSMNCVNGQGLEYHIEEVPLLPYPPTPLLSSSALPPYPHTPPYSLTPLPSYPTTPLHPTHLRAIGYSKSATKEQGAKRERSANFEFEAAIWKR